MKQKTHSRYNNTQWGQYTEDQSKPEQLHKI